MEEYLIDIEEIPMYAWIIMASCLILIVTGVLLLVLRPGRRKERGLSDGKVHRMSDLSFGFDTLHGREDEPEEEPEEEQLPVFNQLDPTVAATPVGPYTSWDYRRPVEDSKQEARFAGYVQVEEPVQAQAQTQVSAQEPSRPESEISSVSGPMQAASERPQAPMKESKREAESEKTVGLRAEEQLLLFKSHELLLTLTDGLKKIASSKSEETRKEKLAELLAAVKLLDVKSEWEEYKSCFEKIYPGFWVKMERTATEEMTPYELRLSALLSLGMGAKEISELTNRSIRTVETTVYKIRKKLGIESEEKTQDFLARLRNV